MAVVNCMPAVHSGICHTPRPYVAAAARLVSWLREQRLTAPPVTLAAPFHRPTSSSMPRSHRLRSVWLKRPRCRSRCIRCSSPGDPRQCCSLGSQSNWKRWTPNARHHRLSDIPCARHRGSWEYLRPLRRPCCRSHHSGQYRCSRCPARSSSSAANHCSPDSASVLPLWR